MKTKKLSKTTFKVIKDFKNLKIGGTSLVCPYFINKGQRIRAGLKVLIGKGSPQDITEEAKMLAMREKVNLAQLNKQEIAEFLNNHNLGIDCSGFVYYILDTELKQKKFKGLKPHIKFTLIKNPLRKLLAKIRPIENTNVKTLAQNENSKEVSWQDIKPSDIIIIIGAGKDKNLDHVLVVTKVEYKKHKPTTIYYSHSLRWSTEVNRNEGIKEGQIKVENKSSDLLEQRWIENYMEGDKNETLQKAKEAQRFELRRLLVYVEKEIADEKTRSKEEELKKESTENKEEKPVKKT
jgi:hypothetical protein